MDQRDYYGTRPRRGFWGLLFISLIAFLFGIIGAAFALHHWNGLEKLINAAQRRRLDNGSFELAWAADRHTVTVEFNLISDSRSASASSGTGNDNGLRGLRLPAKVVGNAS